MSLYKPISSVALIAAILSLAPLAIGDPQFTLHDPLDWETALLGGQITPLAPPQWSTYMTEWELYLTEGDPYPPTDYLSPELYAWEGISPPEIPGLVMAWGDGDTPTGDYAAAWQFDYLEDPDLSNVTITITAIAPPGINQLSFSIRDINGNSRAWYWNVGQTGDPIQHNVTTTIVIDTSKTGAAAANPQATSHMLNPAYNPALAQFLVFDENGYIASQNPVIAPGGLLTGVWNFWSTLTVAQNTTVSYKWDQPPEEFNPGNIYNGWNEVSIYDGPQIVADDWFCETDDPVTDIHWWGSFVNWQSGDLPPVVPDYFDITIWTDVPATSNGFSHPGTILWQHQCFNFTTEFVGWDYDPRTGTFEACFKYEQDLLPDEYFYQDPGQGIYWISIAAVYADPLAVDFPWGWKTRPRDTASTAPDDAVVILDPTAPDMTSAFVSGYPIEFPDGVSWDMAFELTSKRLTPAIKWDQPPVMGTNGCYYGWDEYSIFGDNQIVADDWLCTDARPITDIHWWGSYIGWDYPIAPPNQPAGFHLGIWTDIPATSNGFSHPGFLLNEWTVYIGTDVSEIYDGCDQYPGHPLDACFRYDYYIPPEQWFYQEGADNVYWLSISAIYHNKCDGDTNNSGNINLLDVAEIKIPSCWHMPATACPNADVNGDGIINQRDVDAVMCQITAGWPDPTCCDCLCDGDVTTDGLLNLSDFTLVQMHLGDPYTCPRCDIDCDGDVDNDDLAVIQCQMNAGWLDPSCCVTTVPDYPWGWKTRPHNFNDDAVRIFDPTAPSPGIAYITGEPIEDELGNYWDTAFQLTTESELEPYVKWSQPPVPVEDVFYNGWNEFSVYELPQVVADDWYCDSPDPVSDVHWWGSFLGWIEPEIPANLLPDAFHLGIWTDVPASVDGYSHPGYMIWENICNTFNWEFVGWDIDPRDPNLPPEACFKFDQLLDPDEWFYQNVETNGIYWLSIAAIHTNGVIPDYPWGWKTRPRDLASLAPDDAVRIWDPTAPLPGAVYVIGEPIEWPTGISWDAAFQLTTPPPCVDGDLDRDGDVDIDDFALFASCLSGPGVPYPAPYCDCGDFDKDGDVDLADFAMFTLLYP